MEVKKISPQTLGRYRAEYMKLAKAGFTVKQVQERKRMDCKAIFGGITVQELDTQLDTLNRASASGKREADNAQRDIVLGDTANLCSFLNEIRLTGKTDTKGLKGCVDKLSEDMRYGKGMLTILTQPALDLGELQKGNKVAINPDGLFSVGNFGWDDGSKNPRFQYSAREIPVSKASGYRNDWGFPIHKSEVKAAKVKAEVAIAEEIPEVVAIPEGILESEGIEG